MADMKALDLFCADGGATRGLQLAGFHVTGVDIDAHPRYCGDRFIQGNALSVSLDGYDFIWASPPCQAHTRLRHLHARKYPKLIARTRSRLIKSGIPFCIENVEEAPLGSSGFLIMLCGTMFGLRTADGRAELRRHRLFETSFSIPLRPRCQHGYVPSLSVVGKGGHFTAPKVLTVCGHRPVDNTRPATLTITGTGLDDNRMRQVRAISITGSTPQTNMVRNVVRETFTVQQAREAMGIDWMSMKGLSQAIPPAYSHFIGTQWKMQREYAS
jgi:DNA (cytosine-5)-methyltransferase 1